MKLEHHFKLECDPKIKWRSLVITFVAIWLIYIGKIEIGLSLLTGSLFTKGE